MMHIHQHQPQTSWDRRLWTEGSSWVVGTPLHHDFMLHAIGIYPRHFFRNMRQHMEKVHGKSVKAMVEEAQANHQRGDRKLSEWNVMNGYAYHYMKDEFVWDEYCDANYSIFVQQDPIAHWFAPFGPGVKLSWDYIAKSVDLVHGSFCQKPEELHQFPCEI